MSANTQGTPNVKLVFTVFYINLTGYNTADKTAVWEWTENKSRNGQIIFY